MLRFIPLSIYLLVSFFMEQKQANIGLVLWGCEGGGGSTVIS